MGEPSSRPLGVAVVGYSFMGKAHSNAWRNVGAFYPECPPVSASRCWSAGTRRRSRRPPTATAGPSRPPTGAPSSSATTSTSSTSARPGTSTTRSRSPRSRPASTCWSRSRWPTPSPRPRRWSRRRTPRAQRGVRAMVGFNYRRVPALALARELIAEGRIGDGPAGAGGVPPGLAGRRRRADDLAAAQGDRRLGRPRRPRLARRRPGAAPARRARSRRRAATCARSSRSATGTDGPEPVTVDDAAWATLGTASGAVASVEVSRMATGRKNGLTLEVYGTRGSLVLRPRAAQRAVRAGRPRRRRRRPAPGAGHRGVAPVPVGAGGRRVTCSAGTTRSPSRPPSLLTAIAGRHARPAPSFADGLAVQRVLAAIEESAAALGRSGST